MQKSARKNEKRKQPTTQPTNNEQKQAPEEDVGHLTTRTLLRTNLSAVRTAQQQELQHQRKPGCGTCVKYTPRQSIA